MQNLNHVLTKVLEIYMQKSLCNLQPFDLYHSIPQIVFMFNEKGTFTYKLISASFQLTYLATSLNEVEIFYCHI